MTKQEFIVELTKRLDVNADQFYINAIVDVIRLAHKLDEPVTIKMPLTKEQQLSEKEVHTMCVTMLRKTLTVSIFQSDEDKIIDYIIKNDKLRAVKTYKEATNMGLKDSKDQIENLIIVMNKIFSISSNKTLRFQVNALS